MITQTANTAVTKPSALADIDLLARLRTHRLTVAEGAHRGASVALDLTDVSIGSDLSDSLVLIADDLEPHHATIRSTNILMAGARVTAENGPVTLEDGRLLEPGQWLDIQLPTTLALGSAEVTVAPQIDLYGIARTALLGALLLCMVLIGVKMTSTLLGNGIQISNSFAAVKAATVRVGADATTRDAEATTALRNRLAVAGLKDRVVIEATDDGTVIATGEVSPAEAERWREVLRWLDVQPNRPMLVNNVRKSAADAAMPSFRSVWMGANPSVMLQNGRMAVPGDDLGNGWTLKEIARDGAVIENGGRSVKVAY